MLSKRIDGSEGVYILDPKRATANCKYAKEGKVATKLNIS
jgi:hypothetical protein